MQISLKLNLFLSTGDKYLPSLLLLLKEWLEGGKTDSELCIRIFRVLFEELGLLQMRHFCCVLYDILRCTLLYINKQIIPKYQQISTCSFVYTSKYSQRELQFFKAYNTWKYLIEYEIARILNNCIHSGFGPHFKYIYISGS